MYDLLEKHAAIDKEYEEMVATIKATAEGVGKFIDMFEAKAKEQSGMTVAAVPCPGHARRPVWG